jgi:hypothetical protein
VDHRASVDDAEKRKFLTLRGLKLRPLCLLARRQSLYRLRYRSYLLLELNKKERLWKTFKQNFVKIDHMDLKLKCGTDSQMHIL